MKFLKFWNKSAKKKREHQNRAPRIRLNSLHHIEFQITKPASDTPFKVVNVSATGIGLLFETGATVNSSTGILEGNLKVNDSLHEVRIKIARNEDGFVGGRFVDTDTDLARAIEDYFASEIAALDLAAVNPVYLKKTSDGTPHWFQGTDNTELFYVSDEKDVVRFHLMVLGNYLEGGQDQPLLTADILRDDLETLRYKGSELVHSKRTPEPELLIAAKRLVKAVHAIDVDHRNSLLQFLGTKS